MSTQIVIAMYRPQAGKEHELMALVESHLPTLQKLQLATARQPIVCQAEDGTVMEIFEWASAQSSAEAHEHPEVAMIWEKMGEIASFQRLEGLAEANRTFPHFQPLN